MVVMRWKFMFKIKIRDRETFEIVLVHETQSIAFVRGFITAIGLLTNNIIHVEVDGEEVPLSTLV